MLLQFVLAAAFVASVHGHGMLWDPPNRSSIWRFYPENGPINYDDNQNFCGGKQVQYETNNGLCGPCGDNYRDPIPRANENGGLYGNSFIPKTYKAGTNMQARVFLTAAHLGWFEFHLCDLTDANPETEDCFNKHKLVMVNGTDKYHITPDINQAPLMHDIYLRLPENFTCSRCVLRWHYWTGNSYGYCPDGTNQLGCGDQEVFRSCTDIAIV